MPSRLHSQVPASVAVAVVPGISAPAVENNGFTGSGTISIRVTVYSEIAHRPRGPRS